MKKIFIYLIAYLVVLSNLLVTVPVSVRVTQSDDIPFVETDFLNQRLPIVKKNLEKFLNKRITGRVPKIGLVFSGGGFRAMFLSLGFLKAAQEIGLLGFSTYMAGLSGSTWAMAPWIVSQKNIKDYFESLKKRFNYGLDHLFEYNVAKGLFELIINKIVSWQSIAPVEIYGYLLAHVLLADLKENKFNATLSQTHKQISQGHLPMPIYTAVEAEQKSYRWMEFTPFEMGSSDLKAYIPMHSFGQTFNNGISQNFEQEKALAFCLAIFGSAFAISLKDALFHSLDHMISYSGLDSSIKTFLVSQLQQVLNHSFENYVSDSSWLGYRAIAATVPNYTYNMPDQPLRNQKTLTLVDSGVAFNLPVPPLLRDSRHVDILIIYDASGNIIGAPELLAAEKYARDNNLKFPKINYKDIDKKLVSVFMDKNPEVPLVIYIPRIANKAYSSSFDPEKCVFQDYCATTNFFYNAREIEELSGLSYFTLRQQVDVIKRAIAYKVILMSGKTEL